MPNRFLAKVPWQPKTSASFRERSKYFDIVVILNIQTKVRCPLHVFLSELIINASFDIPYKHFNKYVKI